MNAKHLREIVGGGPNHQPLPLIRHCEACVAFCDQHLQ